MRKINFTQVIFLVSVICMVSCSTNGFFVRKNHQPRVRIEAQVIPENLSPVQVGSPTTCQIKPELNIKAPNHSVEKIKPNIFHRVLSFFYPKQEKILSTVYDHPKHVLSKAKPNEGDDRTTGLIINLLALAFGIAAILMVIGVAHGNLWVYFVVGLVLAAAAIIMGFIGKGMAWKGFGWLAGVIGIIAVVLLVIFMVLVAVVHTTF